MTRTVLITGCSSGIGQCIALGLQASGYEVFATARTEEDLDILRSSGLTAFKLELNDSDSVQRLSADVLAACGGKLYALINNAAYGQTGAVEDLRREVLREQFETNVFGTQELTNALIPAMRQAGEGRIVQISSVLGLVCMPMRGAYSASKFALEALGDNLRLELEGSGVQVSLVEPGPITSKFRENALIKFKQTIDVDNSAHTETYQRELQRLGNPNPNSRFTLPPEAVLAKVQHALESKRARPRYYVTTPTWIFGILRRLLSTRALDALLRKG